MLTTFISKSARRKNITIELLLRKMSTVVSITSGISINLKYCLEDLEEGFQSV